MDPINPTFARSILNSFQRCLFRPSQVVFVFRPPTPFLQGLRFLNQVSILFMWSLFILFNQCSYPVVLMKMLYKFVILRSLSSPVDSIQNFGVNFILFLISQCFLTPVHLLIIPRLLFNCFGVLKISQRFAFPLLIRLSYLEVVISFKPFNSTGAIYLLNRSTVYLLSGP